MNAVDEARQSTSQSGFDRALLDSVNATRPPSDALFNQAFDASTLGANHSVSITYASRVGIDRTASREADLAAHYSADQTEASPAPATDPSLEDEKRALVLDLTQMALDIAGMLTRHPSPTASVA